MRAADFITHIGNREDVPFLRIPLFDVNMRLFASSEGYRNLILAACSYIKRLALESYEDYTQPFGISGANAGIPFNIIGYVVGRKTTRPCCRLMLNPKILAYSQETHVALSNCGSIRLPKPIKVRRSNQIQVRYFTEDGLPERLWFTRPSHGDTIQHEVDHNRGVLITDIEVQNSKEGE